MQETATFRVGDVVVRYGGEYDGVTAKITAVKPQFGLVKTHVKVQIDFKKHPMKNSGPLNQRFRDKWSPVSGWRLFDD